MEDTSNRLLVALEIYLAWQRTGTSATELLAAHPDHADLLASFLEEEEPAAEPDIDGLPAQIGPYRILRELGRGGVGVVYEADQVQLSRRVALKILHEEFAQRPTALARFRREALTLARLDHRGVVRIYDVGDTEGRPWLAMEFVDGTTLADHIQTLRISGGHKGDSLRTLVEHMAEVADALHHVHEAGITHRDVKPSNILLRSDGGAILGDFGLARDMDDPTLTRVGVAAGTPHYMSPERILQGSDAADPRGDVFSLGATLYECITLHRAFDGTTTDLVLQRIVMWDPPDPRKGRRWIPRDLAAIVGKALEKDPKRRYQSSLAFAMDLRAFLELRPIVARPRSLARRTVTSVRREPWKALALLALFFALLLAGVWLAGRPAQLRVQAAQEERVYEDTLGHLLMAIGARDRATSDRYLEQLTRLGPARSETLVHRLLARFKFDGAEAALAELSQHTGTVDPLLERLRAVLELELGHTEQAAAISGRLTPPSNAQDLWLAALVQALTSAPGTAEMREALRMASLATRIAASPRQIMHLQWAACARMAGDATAQQESAEALLRLWPDHPLTLHYAAANIQDQDPARSVELQRRALDLGLMDQNGLANLGVYLFRAGRHEECMEPLLRSLATRPDPAVRGRLVWMALALRDVETANAQALEWLKEAPDDEGALRAAGQLASMRGDDEQALTMLRRAAELKPKDAQAQYNYAIVLDNVKDPAVVEQLRLTLELDPKSDRAHNRLVTVLGEKGDRAALHSELRRRVRVKQEDAEAWRRLGDVAVAAGSPVDLVEGLLAYQRAVELGGGGSPELLAARVEALQRLGANEAAAALGRGGAEGK